MYPDSLAAGDSLLTALLTEMHSLWALQSAVPDTLPVSGSLHVDMSTPWWDWLTALGIFAISALAAAASVFSVRTSKKAYEFARSADFIRRQEDRDIVAWVMISRGIAAVRSFNNLPNRRTEIKRMAKEELLSRYVVPSFVLNRHWSFRSELLNRTWSNCYATFQEEAERMYAELSDVGLSVLSIEPLGAESAFEEASKNLQEAVEQEFGASNPWALGFKDWEPIATRRLHSDGSGDVTT